MQEERRPSLQVTEVLDLTGALAACLATCWNELHPNWLPGFTSFWRKHCQWLADCRCGRVLRLGFLGAQVKPDSHSPLCRAPPPGSGISTLKPAAQTPGLMPAPCRLPLQRHLG